MLSALPRPTRSRRRHVLPSDDRKHCAVESRKQEKDFGEEVLQRLDFSSIDETWRSLYGAEWIHSLLLQMQFVVLGGFLVLLTSVCVCVSMCTYEPVCLCVCLCVCVCVYVCVCVCEHTYINEPLACNRFSFSSF